MLLSPRLFILKAVLSDGPGVSLTLCCFVVYSTRRFVTLCYFVLVFFSPLSIAITLLGEERANLSAFSYVCWICACLVLSVSSSSWCRRAAVSYCGTPWTCLLPFFVIVALPGRFSYRPHTFFNCHNKALTAKLLKQDYRYFKLRKAFSKFYRRHSALVEKYNVSLKTLLQQGVSYGGIFLPRGSQTAIATIFFIFQKIKKKFLKTLSQ